MAPALHHYFCSATKCRHVVLSQKGTACGLSRGAWRQATSLCSPCAMAAVATATPSITTIRATTDNNSRCASYTTPFHSRRDSSAPPW
jgi:hypothetical protein